MLWSLADFTSGNRRSLRVNVSFDHASHVRWSPDGRALVMLRATERRVEVLRVERGLQTTCSAAQWDALPDIKADIADLVALDVADTGRYLLTATSNQIQLWTSRGRALATLDAHLLNVRSVRVSPGARLIAAAGHAPHVRVWCVAFSSNGEFQHVKHAFDLTGHRASIYDIAFDADSSHMVTVSKDGTWKLFQTNVEFEKGEDPRLLVTGNYDIGNKKVLDSENNEVRLALSPSGDVVAIAVPALGTIQWFFAEDGSCQGVLELAPGPCSISKLVFDGAGRWLLVTVGRHVRVFHNVPGHQAATAAARNRLKKSNNLSTAMRERLQQIVAEHEKVLREIATVEAKFHK